MSPPRLLPWIVQLVAAVCAAYGGFVAYELIQSTLVTPRALAGSFWSGALYVVSGIIASVLAFVLTPTAAQADHGRAFAGTALVIRIAAVAGFWVTVLLALFRLARRLLA